MNIDELVNRFLAWKLPDTVRPDLCVGDENYKRQFPNTMSGTCLLTADEAKQMLEHVLGGKFTRQDELEMQIMAIHTKLRPLLEEWHQLYSNHYPAGKNDED